MPYRISLLLTFFLFDISILINGCSSPKVIVSTPVDRLIQGQYSGYDENQKLRYVVSHDSENLYLMINTDNPVTIMKMLRMGLTFYFDLPDQKHKSLYVRYPILDDKSQLSELANANNRPSNEQRPDIHSLISKLPDQALFFADGVGSAVDRRGLDIGLSIEVSAVGATEIDYALTVPLGLISKKGVQGLNEVSLGIESGSPELPRGMSGGARPSTGMPPGGMPPGGGMPGGGMPPGGIPSGQRGMSDMQYMMSTIDIWFQLKIVDPINSQ